MSFIYVASDLHFGHKNIAQFRQIAGISNEEEHREFLISRWNTTVTKRDTVFVLGDACFDEESLEHIARLKGAKVLVRGNHDVLSAATYLTVFKDVEGMVRTKASWLTHAPIHPDELRGKLNVHGHVHFNTINDRRYRNVSMENLIGFRPHKLSEVISTPETCLIAVGKRITEEVLYGEVKM